MIKHSITHISLILTTFLFSCKDEGLKQQKVVEIRSEIDNDTIKYQPKTWQDTILGNTPIKSLIDKGISVEPSHYKVTFNTYRKFKSDSILLRVASSLDQNGHGNIDSLFFNYGNNSYKFKYLNYSFFSPKTLIAIQENKGVNIRFSDFNFDNHPDLAVFNSEGSGVKNIMEDIYIYYPSKKRYYRNKILSENSNISIDTINQTLSTFGQGGMASMIYGSVTYKWENDELSSVRSVNQNYNDSLNLFIRQIDALKDSVWITTIDTLTEDQAREW